MKIYLTCLCYIITMVSCFGPSTESKAPISEERPTAKIEFERTKIFLKNVRKGEIVEGVFRFRNTGAGTLYIEYINPDCTCTAYEVSSKEIRPGQDGWVKLVLDTQDKLPDTRINAVVRTNTTEKFHRLVLGVNIIE